MDSKKIKILSIVAAIILLLGVLLILIHSFYHSFYTLYGNKIEKMFDEEEKPIIEDNTNTIPIKSKDELADSFLDSYVNPLNLTYNNPKTDSYSIKNDYYTYVDKSLPISDNLILHYKIPESATIKDDYNIDLQDMSMQFKINVEKIEDIAEFYNYTYDMFVPEYVNKNFQKVYEDNVLLKGMKQVKVFDYYYYEVYTREYYSTYFVIVQNGYIVSLNTRTSISDYEGTYDRLSEFLSYIYLTSYIEVKK